MTDTAIMTAEDALRERIAKLEADLADERDLRKAAQATNAELLQALLDLRRMTDKESRP